MHGSLTTQQLSHSATVSGLIAKPQLAGCVKSETGSFLQLSGLLRCATLQAHACSLTLSVQCEGHSTVFLSEAERENVQNAAITVAYTLAPNSSLTFRSSGKAYSVGCLHTLHSYTLPLSPTLPLTHAYIHTYILTVITTANINLAVIYCNIPLQHTHCHPLQHMLNVSRRCGPERVVVSLQELYLKA